MIDEDLHTDSSTNEGLNKIKDCKRNSEYIARVYLTGKRPNPFEALPCGISSGFQMTFAISYLYKLLESTINKSDRLAMQ